MTADLLAHFGAARPGRGRKSCACCQGSGEHRDGHECYPCDASGTLAASEPQGYCDDHPPRRRHWRELTADVRRNGVQHPLAIEDFPAHGGPTTFNGMHRLDAAQRAGVHDVPVVVRHQPGKPPVMTEHRPSTPEEFDAAFNLERSGRWAGEKTAARMIHLWHHTSPSGARRIWKDMAFKPEENDEHGRPVVFFSNAPFAQAKGYGNDAVHLHVPEQMARLEDEFPSGEKHYSIPAASIKPEHFRSLYDDDAQQEQWDNWRERNAAARQVLHRGISIEMAPDDITGAYRSGGHPAVHDLIRQHVGEHLGEHWSAREDIARRFAHPLTHEARTTVPSPFYMHVPVVMHGSIAKSHHVSDPDELRSAMVEGHGWQGLTHKDEQETLVKSGAPVRIHHMEASLPDRPDWPEHLDESRWEEHGLEAWEHEPHSWQRIGGPDRHVAVRQQEGDERQFGDYTMRYRTSDEGERRPRHVIEAWHPDHEQAVGKLSWMGTKHQVESIDVHAQHRHKGLATAMWNWSQEMTPRAKHSTDRTDDGKAWVRSLGAAAWEPPSAEEQWGEHLRKLRFRKRSEPLMHRGLAVELPEDVHRFVHDQFQDPDRQAQAIADHLRDKPLGMHWSATEQVSRHFADFERRTNLPGSTKVILHAKLPDVGHIETDRRRLGEGGVSNYGGWGGSEREIPLREDAPVRIKGITWYGYGNRKRTGQTDSWSGEHTAAVSLPGLRKGAMTNDELDQHLENWFHPRRLEANRVIHPRSGYSVETGESRRLHHPAGRGEGPVHFEVWDHGIPGVTNALAYPKKVRDEPVHHVYRGVSADELAQARDRGYLQSDRRGTIADWEGTNAAVDPRSAVSYLPRNGTGHVLKIRHELADKWFTHSADDYIRTRERIPMDRVESISPEITKGDQGNIKVGVALPNSQLKLFDMTHQPRPLANPHTKGSEWFHGSPHRFAKFDNFSPLEFDHDESDTSHWNTLMGSHFTADHHVAREFSKGEHRNPDYEQEDPDDQPAGHIVHARLNIRNPKHYHSEHDMDQEVYEHEWKAGNHPEKHLDMATYRDAQKEGWHDELREEIPAYHFVDHGDRMRDRREPDPMRAGHHHTAQHTYAMGWLNAHPDKYEIAQRFRKHLEDQGHDGITYGNEFEKSSRGAAANTSAIAFRPHQIEARLHEGNDDRISHEAATAGPVSRLSAPLPQGTRWMPARGIFGPTYGLDHRLFTEAGELRPEVRESVMEKWDAFCRDQGFVHWQAWSKVYLSGSEASRWTGPELEGNNDLDILVGINYSTFYRDNPGYSSISESEIDGFFNKLMRSALNDPDYHLPGERDDRDLVSGQGLGGAVRGV
jgi:hypothetical protein